MICSFWELAGQRYHADSLSFLSATAISSAADRQGYFLCLFSSRKQIENSLSAPHHPPQFAPSTRQAMSETERQDRLEKGEQAIWRLDAMRASELAGRAYTGQISAQNSHLVRPEEFGDVIIGRRDMPGSYHLSVVIDDADSNIELVVRGEDLLGSTPFTVCFRHCRLVACFIITIRLSVI